MPHDHLEDRCLQGAGDHEQGVLQTWPLTGKGLTGTTQEGLQEAVSYMAPGGPVTTETAGERASRTTCHQQAVTVAAPSRLPQTACFLFFASSILFSPLLLDLVTARPSGESQRQASPKATKLSSRLSPQQEARVTFSHGCSFSQVLIHNFLKP